jgi:hypothetical protein
MSLIAMQRDMRAWLTLEDRNAAARLGDRSAPGLRVHQNNYRVQLIGCLTDSFPRTLAWIGGEAFEGAAATHIDRVPPSSWTLDAYPRDFPETLAAGYSDDPEVAELAWIEAALGEAFVAAGAATLQPDDLRGVDWDNAVLILTPTLDLGELTTNAPAIWSALTAGEVPPAAELLPEPGAVLVWRHEQVSRFRAVDRIERQALLHARAGMPFTALCDAMVALLGEADGVAFAGQLLGQWTIDGLIAATA